MLQYPESALQNLYEKGAGGMLFTFYDRPDSQTATFSGNVLLYIPEQLENPMNIQWGQRSGLPKKIVSDWANGKITMDNFTEKAKQYLTSAGQTLNPAQGVMNVATRKIANPYIAMTFEAIGFREFTFTFRFTPHNESEAKTVYEIIKKFRKTALPTGCAGARMGFPGEIQVNYVGMASMWLNFFKPSVITNVHINYTSQGFYSAMENGFPAETTMSLSMTENQLVCREDVEIGY